MSLAFFGPVARIHAAGLEIAADRAGADLAIGALPGQPDLDVIGLLRGEAHVAGREHDGAEGKLESFQHVLGAFCHALMLFRRLLRRGDGDELDLVELMLADHAAGVFAGGAGLGAEAWRAGGDADGELGLVDDVFADEIGERHFGGGDEPSVSSDALQRTRQFLSTREH